MSLRSETYFLDKTAYIIEGDNIIFNYHRCFGIFVAYNFRTDNYDYYEGALNKGSRWIATDMGYACPDPSPNSKGHLIVSCGWGDGFAIRKMKSAGSMSVLFHDNTPVAGTTTVNSLAVDKVRYNAYVGRYASAGIAKYDFSDTSSISLVDTITSADGITYDQPGYPYFNGLAFAGDYLYLGHYEAADVATITKWNTQDSSSDDLLIANRVSNVRYGHMRYDEKRDRVYASHVRNGDIVVIVSASFASSSVSGNQALCIRANDVGLTNDMYTHGLIPYEDEGDYHYLANGYYGRYMKVDIGPLLTGSLTWGQDPVILQTHPEGWNIGTSPSLYYPRWEVTAVSDVSYVTHSSGRSFIIKRPDRGLYFQYWQWFDQENFLWVGDNVYITYGYGDGSGTSGGSNATTWTSEANNLAYAYGGIPITVRGEDDETYFVFGPYASNTGFYSWSRTRFPDGFGLCATASLTFGDFTLGDNLTIGSIYIGEANSALYTGSGAKMNMKVSNDGGTTYETYNYENDVAHHFTSSGATARLKLEFTGSISQSAYYYGSEVLSVTLFEEDPISDREKVIGYSTFNIAGV